jgi:putative ABC transport system substrate-binding protein
VDRRRFLLTSLAGAVAGPVAARSQTVGKIGRVGILSPTPPPTQSGRLAEELSRRLQELGWVEGKNLVIEYRWADGRVDRLPALAAELVRLEVDLIVAPGTSAALAAKNATRSIPIVMMFSNDPVALGLVVSLRHPGGNVTGTTFTAGSEIFGKQLQILKEMVPSAKRVALLSNTADPNPIQIAALEAAARSMGLALLRHEARGPDEFDSAFDAMARERTDALVVTSSSTLLRHRLRLAELALKARLPTMFGFREMVDAGGLMAYGVNMGVFVAHSAAYVDKILRGAKPADLPVEQPAKFELAINVKTARALGIVVPPSLLTRADGLIR